MQIIEITQEKTDMAILKHIASKNADYGEAERYLISNMMNIRKNQFLMIMGICFFVKNIIWMV